MGKFVSGQKVKVVAAGSGFAARGLGSVVTLKRFSKTGYGGKPGWTIEENLSFSNSSCGSYNGFHGENSFEAIPGLTVPKVHLTVNAIKTGWIVGSISTEGLSFATKPVIHLNIEVAKAEAERLAKSSHKKFIVVKVEGAVQKANVVWEV